MSNIDRILAALKKLYNRRPKTKQAWPQEEPHVRQIVSEIASELVDQYELVKPIDIGGSGVVLRVRDLRLGVDKALKFSRPSPRLEETLASVLATETDRLLELSHPYVMRIHAKGEVSSGGHHFPYYVMDFYDSVKDADKYVSEEITEDTFIQLLERVLEAVAYLHDQGIVHMDIKPGNILVTPDNRPLMVDFGFAKVLQDDHQLTICGGTEGFIHPDARQFIVEASSDPNRLRGEVVRSALNTTWDLYSLGQTILRLLAALDKRGDRPLSLYTHRYVKLLACRLLDGRNDEDERLLGLTRTALGEISYDRVHEALRDTRKLTGGFNLETRVPELEQFGSNTIQASTFSTTPFTPRVKALVEHEDIERLAGFTQLSLLNLVYPTATHTRLEHTIGAFSAMCRYITALNRDPINPLFRQIMTEDDVAAALVVALVHDVGHYALAHDLEEAEREVFSHENRGKEILKDQSPTGLKAILEDKDFPSRGAGWGVEVERVLAILNADVTQRTGTVKDRIIHALIDGPIDADKLDYIIRDSINLGLTYGSIIDVERLLRVLTVVTRQDEDETFVTVGIHEKGRVTAEAVAFARYALYGSVYWHHAYRAVKVMLQRIAWEHLDLATGGAKRNRGRVGKKVRKELHAALRREGGGAPQSLPLTEVTASTKLHPGDRAVLQWFAERSGPTGRELAELIEQRKLFKRVLVISRWGESERLWKDVTNLFKDDDWGRKLDFQRLFQERLVLAVKRFDHAEVRTDLDLVRERSRFLAAAETQLLVLVDATRAKPGASSGLVIVQEEDRRRARIDEVPTNKSAESELWKSLQANLQESLGKVRIFCHPEHARYVSTFPRNLMQRALRDARSAV